MLGRLIFKAEFGSHIYGTSTPQSDKDFKGVYIPCADDILLQRAGKTSFSQNTKSKTDGKNTSDDVDQEFFTLQSFIRLCAEGQTVALDMLFTPEQHWLIDSHEWRFIQKNRALLLHRGVSAFVGYCQKQAAKYGIKGSRMRAVKEAIQILNQHPDRDTLNQISRSVLVPDETDPLVKWVKITKSFQDLVHWEVCGRKIPVTATVAYAKAMLQRIYDQYGERARMAESNEGVDWKALYHAVRVLEEAKELLTTGHVTFPRPEAALLLDIRNQKKTYLEVANMVEEGMNDLRELQRNSELPSQIDSFFWEEFIKDCYKKEVMK